MKGRFTFTHTTTAGSFEQASTSVSPLDFLKRCPLVPGWLVGSWTARGHAADAFRRMNEGVAARLRRNRTAYPRLEPPRLYQRTKRPPSALFQRTDGLLVPIPMAAGLLANSGTGPQRHVARWPGHAMSSEEGEEVWRAQLRLALALLDRADDVGIIPQGVTAQTNEVRTTLRGRLQQHVTPHSTPSTEELDRMARPGGPSYGDLRFGGAFARAGSGGSGIAGTMPSAGAGASGTLHPPQGHNRSHGAGDARPVSNSSAASSSTAVEPSTLAPSSSSPAILAAILPPPGITLHPALDEPARSRPGSAMRPGVLAGTALYDGWDGRNPQRVSGVPPSAAASRPVSAKTLHQHHLPTSAAQQHHHTTQHPAHATAAKAGAAALRPLSAATTSAAPFLTPSDRTRLRRQERSRQALAEWKAEMREARLAFTQGKHDELQRQRRDRRAAARTHVAAMADEVRWLRSHSAQKRTVPATIRLGVDTPPSANAKVVTDAMLANFGKAGQKRLSASERLLANKAVPVDIEAQLRGGYILSAIEMRHLHDMRAKVEAEVAERERQREGFQASARDNKKMMLDEIRFLRLHTPKDERPSRREELPAASEAALRVGHMLSADDLDALRLGYHEWCKHEASQMVPRPLAEQILSGHCLTQAQMQELRGRVGRAVPGANYLEGISPPDLSGEADLEELRAAIKADEAAAVTRKRQAKAAADGVDASRIDVSTPTADMRAELEASGVAPLDDEQLWSLSRLYNETLEASLSQSRAESRAFHTGHGSWMNLFSEMDVDKSGGITYDEFERVTRARLNIKGTRLSEQKLRVLWCKLDADDSDVLRVDEFGRFLRLAPVEHESERELAAKSAERRKKIMTLGSATADGLRPIDESPPTSEMRAQLAEEGVPLPTEAELLELSCILTEKLEASRTANSTATRTFSRGGSHTFMNLIAELDEDGSGVVTFDELKHVVRSKLKMTAEELPGKRLRALWCALDADDSSSIAIDEMAAFITGNARILRKLLAASEIRAREAQEHEERVQAIVKIQSMQRGKNARKQGNAKAKTRRKLHTGEAEPTTEMRSRLRDEGVAPLAVAELLQLSTLLCEKLEAARQANSTSTRSFVIGKASTFMNLFAELDEDRSGVVTFDELKRVVRKKCEIGMDELPANKLIGLWCALDADDSNSIAIDEMAAFLKGDERTLGKLVASGGGDWRRAGEESSVEPGATESSLPEMA